VLKLDRNVRKMGQLLIL